MSDPQKYRTKDEVESFKEQDSIARLLSQLMDSGDMTEESWKEMQSEIKSQVREAMTVIEQFIGLDTGCVWGRCMTAMRLEDGQLFQVEGNLND